MPESAILVDWRTTFPTGREIFQHTVSFLPRAPWSHSMDELLLKRRELEFKIFEKIEQLEVLPNISGGFTSVEEFIKYAHSVSNRRKSRTGTSLELNLEAIFRDERIAFETQAITENRKKTDFLFPSGRAYHDHTFPEIKLHMLASKTCCKDRWRQVLNEANRIVPKHLFTLQQGVSGNQLQEMEDNNVKLVVPAPYRTSFPKEWRGSLMTLEGFISHVRSQQAAMADLDKWII